MYIKILLEFKCENILFCKTFTVPYAQNHCAISQHMSIATKYIFIDISKVKLATVVEGNPKAPFSIATTPRCRGGCYSFPRWLYFTLDPHLIMLSVKQGGIKYHFLSLCYDSTWD